MELLNINHFKPWDNRQSMCTLLGVIKRKGFIVAARVPTIRKWREMKWKVIIIAIVAL